MELKQCDEMQVRAWLSEGKRFVCYGREEILKRLCENTALAAGVDYLVDHDDTFWGTYLDFIPGLKVKVLGPELVAPGERIVLLTTIFFRKVFEYLQELASWQDVQMVYYFPTPEDKIFDRRLEYWQSLPLENKVVFRSGLAQYVPGFDFSDNARALYEYMISQGYNETWQLVWYVHDVNAHPELKDVKNVTVVSYEWETSEKTEEHEAYFYHLCTAKYLFFTDAYYWLRFCRKGQIRVNLWHGCGFKGRKTRNGAPAWRNYEYMTVTSPLYADIHAKEFGFDRNKILCTGLAKEDWLFHTIKQELWNLFPIAKARKYVFWTPTFRMAAEGLERLNEYELSSDTGLPIVTTIELAERLNKLLSGLGIGMIVKLHPVQRNTLIAHLQLSHICVLENADIAKRGLQINQLLTKADAMISDYSSIAVDYMLLDRPIAFMLDDAAEYGESRGFVFDNLRDFLPGKELYNFIDLCNFVKEIAIGNDSTREKRGGLLKLMHSRRDGYNCKRVLATIGMEKHKCI